MRTYENAITYKSGNVFYLLPDGGIAANSQGMIAVEVLEIFVDGDDRQIEPLSSTGSAMRRATATAT